MIKEKLDSTADRIFGPDDSDEKSRWIKYWADGKHRYLYYIEQLQRILPADFSRARILDIGCGSGGLDLLLKGGCRLYAGIDFKMHVLQLTRPSHNGGYIQGNGIRLPLPDSSFDFIFAFDVLEHLKEGTPWQREFLKEIRRVLSPLGIAMLSTPNYWYPYDAHSRTSCPQFMPAFLADRYVNWRNPEFIKEHESFRNIRLIHPGRFRRLIREAGLLPLHQLPCCLDRSEYLRLHPILGILPYVGLGWLPHAEFWLILTRKRDHEQMRLKLKKQFQFKINVTASDFPFSYKSEINFSDGPNYHQLGKGWHWPEKEEDNFRWIECQAYCYLEALNNANELRITGYSTIETKLSIFCEKQIVGIHRTDINQSFKLRYRLPFTVTEKSLLTVKICSSRRIVDLEKYDSRELSVQIASVKIDVANEIYRPANKDEEAEFIDYWRERSNLAACFLEMFKNTLQTDLNHARVLDLGCGAAGFGLFLKGKCNQYIGIDINAYLLGRQQDRFGSYVQCNGIRLPFPDSYFDQIFIVDVLDYICAAESKTELLQEIRRIISPLGSVLLSMPNYWFPLEPHSGTIFPKFLPSFTKYKYIRYLISEFITHDFSFRNVRLLGPRRLYRLIKKADLALLFNSSNKTQRNTKHEPSGHSGDLPFIGFMKPTLDEFWMILTRKEDRDPMRVKLKKNLQFPVNSDNLDYSFNYQDSIDFSLGNYYHQLGKGWHWPESEKDNFRWIERQAECYLEASEITNELRISGYSPIDTVISVYCRKQLLGVYKASINKSFWLRYKLPFMLSEKCLLNIRITSSKQMLKNGHADSRELSVQIFSIEMAPYNNSNYQLENMANEAKDIRYRRHKRNHDNNNLSFFKKILQSDFNHAKVLDLGCRETNLRSLLEDKCKQYAGIDISPYLSRSNSTNHYKSVQSEEITLPFPDSSFDYIFAVEVFRNSETSQFENILLKEIGRVLSPLGSVLLSSPNFWPPCESNFKTTFLNPSFSLKYKHIKGLIPKYLTKYISLENIQQFWMIKFNKSIKRAGLSVLHNSSCALFQYMNQKLFRLSGRFPFFEIGRPAQTEFWIIMTREKDHDQMRIKLKRNLYFPINLDNLDYSFTYQDCIDFSLGDYYHQLGKGWHWPENKGDNFRWIERQAVCYLESSEISKKLKISGFSPIETRLSLYCDDRLLGIYQAGVKELFKLEYSLLAEISEKHLFRIKIKCSNQIVKDKTTDSRELSVQIFSIGVTK